MPSPWPQHSILHEVFSLRKWLLSHPLAPAAIVAREIEGDFERPMVRITPISDRVQNLGVSRYNVIRTMNFSYFGSTPQANTDLNAEAYLAGDWLMYALGRDGAYQGPIVQIYDFARTPEVPTDSWIMFTASTVDKRQDQWGLWTVMADVTYHVEHAVDPALIIPSAPGPPDDFPTEGSPAGPPMTDPQPDPLAPVIQQVLIRKVINP